MTEQSKNFVLLGAAGYIAPRHMRAIADVGGTLVAALDPSDSVGVIDSYFPDADFFVEFERFDRHIDKLHRRGLSLDFATICTPNYLHDAHIRFALRSGLSVICEKPLVINARNIAPLQEIERESGKTIYTVLQLRLHPAVIALKEKIENSPTSITHEVDLAYITSRGNWYDYSWKGDPAKSGGVTTNIGIHFFDMLGYVFGEYKSISVHLSEQRKAAGSIEFERARVRWFLSVDREDLPATAVKEDMPTYRSLEIDGTEFEFSSGFDNLHTRSYQEILNGKGFRLSDAGPSIQIVSDFRSAAVERSSSDCHPIALKHL
jgi:UDP-N-acetyl-2-amino-2-deoxyglucuronate dehydrogenase